MLHFASSRLYDIITPSTRDPSRNPDTVPLKAEHPTLGTSNKEIPLWIFAFAHPSTDDSDWRPILLFHFFFRSQRVQGPGEGAFEHNRLFLFSFLVFACARGRIPGWNYSDTILACGSSGGAPLCAIVLSCSAWMPARCGPGFCLFVTTPPVFPVQPVSFFLFFFVIVATCQYDA